MLEIEFNGELPQIETVYIVHDALVPEIERFKLGTLTLMLFIIFAFLAYVVWEISISLQVPVLPAVP